MMNRRALLLPILAAALAHAAAPAADAAQASAAAREARAVAADVVRAVTRYQGNRNQNRFQQIDRQTRTVKVGPAGALELRNIAGDITVVAGGRDTATIEITKTASGASDAEARQHLGLVRVDVVELPARVEVRAVYPQTRGRGQRNVNVSTAYRVTAPAGTRIRTDTISGDVNVSGVRGELTLSSISGNIVVRDAGRRVAGQTISGTVDLVSAQNDAVVDLSSTSGNVTARGLKVRRMDLGSISGNIIGRDIQCDQANLHTMSGDVEYTGALTSGGRYEFRTHSGDVRLTVGEGVGFELEASTFSGEVRSGLQLRLEGATGRRTRTIRGVFGDGRARVDARSFSGNVLINGR